MVFVEGKVMELQREEAEGGYYGKVRSV